MAFEEIINEFIIFLRPSPAVQSCHAGLNFRSAEMLNNPTDFLTVCVSSCGSVANKFFIQLILSKILLAFIFRLPLTVHRLRFVSRALRFARHNPLFESVIDGVKDRLKASGHVYFPENVI